MARRASPSSSCSCWLWRILAVCLMLLLPLAGAETFLWPLPRNITWGTGPSIPLSYLFRINTPPKQRELSLAAARFTDLIRKEKWVPVQVSPETSTSRTQPPPADNPVQPLEYLDIVVHNPHADLQHGVDESYTLSIPDGGVSGTLSAATIWGALHGLETFSQLLCFDSGDLFVEHGVRIDDAPLYPHRGILLDTSRNFYPVNDILRTIRGLSHNKLNVLHWVVMNSQSFPIEIASEPTLAQMGSYGPGYIYSQKDVKEIIEYARLRGVRIIPEVDVPGHAASWGAAYPEIVTCRDEFWWYQSQPWSERMASEPTPGQLNPLQLKTYEVVKNVIEDIGALFPDNLYHSGGDEIAPNCWMSDKDIKSYVANGGNLSSLLEKFISTTYPYIISQKKTAIYWEDVLLDATVNVSASVLPPETTILETWNNGPLNTKRLTSAGYRTIVASSDFYYLDCGRGSFLGNETRVDQQVNPDPQTPNFNYGGTGGSWCAPYKSWQRIYDYDITYNLTKEEAKLVVGGEVALWSEQADGTVLDGLLWPRSAALAESLWSGNQGAALAINRLNDWRFRLVSRGIGAAPLQPLWCLKNPNQCNLV